MPHRLMTTAAAAVAMVAVATLPLGAQEAAKSAAQNKAPPSKDASAVAALVRQLDDDRFAVREEATAKLIKAGREAVAPLAKAASEGGPEVVVRAVHILSQLGVSDDSQTAEAARLALENLSDGPMGAARDRAEAALETLDAREADRALERLKAYGAYFGTGRFVGEEAVPNHLIVPKKWSGGNDGIKLLRFVRDVNYVSIHGGKISDDALPHLQKLKHLSRLELYGTDISEKGFEKLKSALQGVDVDVRGGGLLGVQGQPEGADCQITVVRPNLAAAKAGLEPGDIILKCDGKEIDKFSQLLEYIRPKKPGVKVTLTVRRGEMTFEREVVLSEWGDEAEPRPEKR